MVIFKMKTAHCCVDKHMDIQIFSQQPASEMGLLLVNIPYSLTNTISHYKVTKALFLHAKQVSRVTGRRWGALEGGGWGWEEELTKGPSRGLRAPFISLSKANWDYQSQAW